LQGLVDWGFAVTSRRLSESLDGEGRRSRTGRRLRAAIEERFAELVATELTELDEDSRKKVLTIPDAHRTLYEIKLDGYLERFLDSGATVQLVLMADWLQDPAVSATVMPDSLSLWSELQRRLLSHDAADVRFDDFVNLRARKFIERLDSLDIPILEKATQEARL
jgi:hypothetical protein